MSTQLQPSVPLVILVKTESPTVIKNEPPEEALEKEISLNIKDIDIVYHSFSEDLLKNETETKYSESVETQVLIKTEDTSGENVTRGSDQEVIVVQGSHEHSNTLSNLETHEQLVLNSSKDLNDIGTRSRKAKHTLKTDFARCYKTDGTTSWEKKDKEKIKVIKAPLIPVKPYEYTLAKVKYVCNYCQHAYITLNSLKRHIKQMHREVTAMYQCPYCPYKFKWSVREHIIQKHKDTKDIQWFQCNLCEMKFKLKNHLTKHMKVHLRHTQMKNGLDLREKRSFKMRYCMACASIITAFLYCPCGFFICAACDSQRCGECRCRCSLCEGGLLFYSEHCDMVFRDELHALYELALVVAGGDYDEGVRRYEEDVGRYGWDAPNADVVEGASDDDSGYTSDVNDLLRDHMMDDDGVNADAMEEYIADDDGLRAITPAYTPDPQAVPPVIAPASPALGPRADVAERIVPVAYYVEQDDGSFLILNDCGF